MTTLLVVIGISFATCVVLTPLVRKLAAKYSLVDQPDGRRKLHAAPTPLGGGLAILLSGNVAVLIAAFASPLQQELAKNSSWLIGLCLASITISVVGLADDRGQMRGRTKLFWQLLTIAVVMSCGVQVRNIGFFGWNLDLGLLAIPFTAFLLLGAINSLNLMDGMDGLLSCVGLIICLAMATLAALADRWAAACVAIALAGALLGFLRYNFPPASIFMGDCGSMPVGLVIGVLAIQSSLKGPATVALATPVAVLTIPIFDTLAAIIRRKLTGRSLYATDRGHLHHCLLRRGLSTRKALLYVSCFCLVTVAGALTSIALKNELWAILSALAVVGILILTRLFGFAEFVLVRNHLTSSAASWFRRSANGKLDRVEVRIQGSADWTGLWHELMALAEDLDLQSICLNINAPALQEGYLARWDRVANDPDDFDLWRAQIPVAANGHSLGRLEIVGRRDHESTGAKIQKLSGVIENLDFSMAPFAELAHANSPRSVSAATELNSAQMPIHVAVIQQDEVTDLLGADDQGNGTRLSAKSFEMPMAIRPKKPK